MAADNFVRSLSYGAAREYRVHVGYQQNSTLARAGQGSDDIITNTGHGSRYSLDPGTDAFEFNLQNRAHGGHACDIAGARVNLHELLQECPRLRFARLGGGEDPGVRSSVRRRDRTDRKNREDGRKDHLRPAQFACESHWAPLGPSSRCGGMSDCLIWRCQDHQAIEEYYKYRSPVAAMKEAKSLDCRNSATPTILTRLR